MLTERLGSSRAILTHGGNGVHLHERSQQRHTRGLVEEGVEDDVAEVAGADFVAFWVRQREADVLRSGTGSVKWNAARWAHAVRTHTSWDCASAQYGW